jgi:hypothetical protein
MLSQLRLVANDRSIQASEWISQRCLFNSSKRYFKQRICLYVKEIQRTA